MFEKIFRRVCKKSRFCFFFKKEISSECPVATLNNVFETLPLSGCQNSRVCCSKKRKKFKNNKVIKWIIFPKFGQIACCFGQDCRNNKFLQMFEKNFQRFRKKSGFYVFFLDYNFAQNVPLDTHNYVFETLPLPRCQNSRVCWSKKRKKFKNHCNKMILFPGSWTSCMLFLTKLPKKRLFAVVRKKISKSPLEIMILWFFL